MRTNRAPDLPPAPRGDYLVATSRDGTRVGCERVGTGPALLAVHGGTADRSRWNPIRDLLAEHFTVHLLDRRGRGLSVEEADGPYDLSLEAEDIAAVVEMIGSPTVVLGHSYGASCCIEAALISAGVSRMVLYEPGAATPGHDAVDADVIAEWSRLLAAGDREGLLADFMTRIVGVDADAVAAMRGTEIWNARVRAAHTILREAAAVNTFRLDPVRLSGITVPVRILVGSESPPWLRAAAMAAHTAIRDSELVTLAGQGHMAIDMAPALVADQVITLASAR